MYSYQIIQRAESSAYRTRVAVGRNVTRCYAKNAIPYIYRTLSRSSLNVISNLFIDFYVNLSLKLPYIYEVSDSEVHVVKEVVKCTMKVPQIAPKVLLVLHLARGEVLIYHAFTQG